jgi:DNA-binding response OmpR family regulator
MKKQVNKSSDYKKVLIVDDYEITCSMVAMYFSEFGYTADSAGTAKDGLELALENYYEVILVDLCLPDYSGLNLIKQLRSYEYLAKSKIIIFTGNDGETINYYRQYGVDGLLLKPCTLAKVREVINTCLITPRKSKSAL